MPTAGTHITLIERLALDPDFAEFLGDPVADEDDPSGLQMRYAKLGAIGPDLFYALLDYGSDVQDLANFFAKYSGAVACIGHVMGDLEAFGAKVESDVTFGVSDTAKQIVGEIKEVATNTTAILNQLVTIAVTDSYNFFTIFEAQRQQDRPRTQWYWADYLHYVRSGRFVRELFVNAKDDPNLRAYAFGYLSHYVTDVVGHPFVNQVVGAPWRLYWQRHHLVENFIDTYVWDRWHDAHPAPAPPSTEEAPLDSIRATAHSSSGAGAPYTYARLNDHINIGAPTGQDPVDQLILGICKKIDSALEDVGIAEPMPTPPGDATFAAWTHMLANTFQSTYKGITTPENLKNPKIGGPGRTSGFPTPEDIGSAYVVLRLFLRSATEDNVKEPEFPDIGEDVWNAIKQMLDKVGQDLSSITPPPGIGDSGGSFSFSSLWKSLKHWVEWACDTATKLVDAAFDLLKGILNAAGTLIVDLVKAALYLIKKGLYELYKAFRFFLVRTAYAMPFTSELNDTIAGSVMAASLWNTPRTRQAAYPIEEVPHPERDKFLSSYAPWMFPTAMPEVQALGANVAELPLTWPGPYAVAASAEAFTDRPPGKRKLLDPSGPIDLKNPPNPVEGTSDFGGAMVNCREAFQKVATMIEKGQPLPPTFFPDYNLDGDRGYAWPCWDVKQTSTGLPAQKVDPASTGAPVTVAPVLLT
jgi:Zinc dependent phospholipase C